MKELVKIEKQNVITSSRIVAEYFNKRHTDVLEAVEAIISKDAELSKQNGNLGSVDFVETSYKVNGKGRKYKEYIMTHDGFMLLAMGFSGIKAHEFKREFIAEFKKMRTALQERNIARLENPAMCTAVEEHRTELGKETKFFHYSTEQNLIYLIVLGCTAKKYKELELQEGQEIRDCLSPLQIEAVEKIQKMNTTLIELGLEYKDRKKQLNAFFEKKYSDRMRIEFSQING